MHPLGPGEWLLIAFIAALLYGNRLPDLSRRLGRGIEEFREGISYERRWTPRDRYEAEKQAEEFNKQADQFGSAVVVVFGVIVGAVVFAYLLRALGLC